MANKIRFTLWILMVCALYFCSETNHKKSARKRIYNTLTPKHISALPAELFESSGLLYSDKKLWTINDNGGLACLYQIDTLNGNIKQKVFIDNYPNIDWEEITADENYIYIGDFGNNYGNRKNLRILKINKKDISSKKEVHLNAEAINFSYKMQQNYRYDEYTTYDGEAMISLNNYLYLFSMNRGGKKCMVYKIPKTPGHHETLPIHRFHADGKITGACYDSTQNTVLIIGYSGMRTHPFVWRFKNFENDNFLHGNQEYYYIGNEKAWQVEAITFVGKNKAYFSCETSGEKVAGIYQLNLD
jgi:hypothetical protein